MLKQSLITMVTALAIASPAVAQKTAYNIPVADRGAGTFDVINKWSSRDDDIWCAAAKAAVQRGASYRERLYVVGVVNGNQSQYGAETITFTYRPSQEQLAQAKSGQSSVRGVGNNLTINSANRRCVRELDFY